VGQQNNSPIVKFNWACSEFCIT